MALVAGAGCGVAEERSAREDVVALGSAVADFVVENGTLPRIGVTTRVSGPDVVAGDDFLVETIRVPRADPSVGRVVFLVGDVERWCVEALYNPPATISDASPAKWVAAKARLGEVGVPAGGRCGDGYVLRLSPVTSTEVPASGSVVNAATALLGTCLVDPFSGTSAGGDAQSTGLIEVVACQSEHFGEIYHSAVVDAADVSSYEDTVAAECRAAFEPFVGVPFNLSALVGEPFSVSPARFNAGDRQFSCFLYLGAHDYPIVGSARDSWR